MLMESHRMGLFYLMSPAQDPLSIPNFIKIGQETEKLRPFFISDKIKDLSEKMN